MYCPVVSHITQLWGFEAQRETNDLVALSAVFRGLSAYLVCGLVSRCRAGGTILERCYMAWRPEQGLQSLLSGHR